MPNGLTSKPCQYKTISRHTTQHNTKQVNTTQHKSTQNKSTQHNTTQHNTTQHKTSQHNTTRHDTTQNKSRQTVAVGRKLGISHSRCTDMLLPPSISAHQHRFCQQTASSDPVTAKHVTTQTQACNQTCNLYKLLNALLVLRPCLDLVC